jgi:hypothetical protein
MTMVVNANAEVPGEEAATTVENTKMRMTTTVGTVTSEGVAGMTVKLETLAMTVDGQAQDLTGQETQEFNMTVDKTGKVLAVQGADGADAASSLLESGNLFDSNSLANEFTNILYPADGTAKVGEEWTIESTVPLSGLDQELTVTTKAKLVSVSTENGRQVATIAYTTSVPMDLELDLGALLSAMMGGSEGSSDFGFKMTMKGTMEFTGTGRVDTATGQAISSDAAGSMDIQMEITEAPEMSVPKDQRGPFATTMTMTMSVVEVK